MTNWISVKDKLPKTGRILLVFGRGLGFAGGGEVRIGALWDSSSWVVGEGEFEQRDAEVTHWMPMPEPPMELE